MNIHEYINGSWNLIIINSFKYNETVGVGEKIFATIILDSRRPKITAIAPPEYLAVIMQV